MMFGNQAENCQVAFAFTFGTSAVNGAVTSVGVRTGCLCRHNISELLKNSRVEFHPDK